MFHRKRGDRLPQQVRYNLPIEILYTVLPFIMVGVLFYFTARDENKIDKIPAQPQVIVNVLGSSGAGSSSTRGQGPGQDRRERSSPRSARCGTAAHDTTSSCRCWRSPRTRPCGSTCTSIDVIHSFWVVPFEFKRDVIPGYANHFAGTATKTGSFIGRCTELCGVYHSRMLFRIKIVSPAQFQSVDCRRSRQPQNSSGGVQ